MAEERDPTEDVSGTSEPTTDPAYVENARADAGARDIVGARSDDDRASTDGVYDEERLADPAFQAVIEGGGGVAEGFEQAEAALVANATDSEGSTRDILFDAIDEADGDDPENFGEADGVREADGD